jgi:hypothetical protein
VHSGNAREELLGFDELTLSAYEFKWQAELRMISLIEKSILGRKKNLLGQSILQEIPIHANTVHKLVKNGSELARLPPKGLWKVCWEQGEWSMKQTNTRDCC